jgi:hypothetical protein
MSLTGSFIFFTGGFMSTALNEMSNDRRLEVYDKLASGVQHVYSKGKLQEDRLNSVLDILLPLRTEDPIFLAHLTSYVIKKSDNKDLKTIITLVNALSDADGTPFDPSDTDLRKPNLRLVSHAAIQQLDPKQVRRIFELAGLKTSTRGRLVPRKFGIDNNISVHIPRSLRSAVRKYLRFRESTPNGVTGIVKAGLKNIFSDLFRLSHTKPMPTTAIKLRWEQKDNSITKGDFIQSIFDFSGLSDVQVAKKIVSENISARAALGAIDKLTPVIAVAILQVATGDEVIILTKMLEDSGILTDKEVQKEYKKKVKTSKNAIDRIKSFADKTSRDISCALDESRAAAKQEMFEKKTTGLGKVFFHLDLSGSMQVSIDWIKNNASTIIEMIPEDKFGWGAFNSNKIYIANPKKYSVAGINQALYGMRASGGTDCLALYETARSKNSEVDIFITDQGHTGGHYKSLLTGRTYSELSDRIKQYHIDHPDHPKPKACIVIDSTMTDRGAVNSRTPLNAVVISGRAFVSEMDAVKRAYEANGIPVTVFPTVMALNSALLTEQIAIASKGRMAIIDEIMEIPLLHPPQWYFAIKAK